MLKLTPNRPPVVGDRFEILATVDSAGRTWQYLAWDNEREQWCAVRMLGFHHVRDAGARSRFEREVQCLEKVKHPNVLAVISSDAAHPTHPWVATAVAEAGSIADWMELHGPLPAYLAIDVMAQVCGGLSAAHRAGVAHGGVTADSVLIDRNGSCVLTGFRGTGSVQTDVKDAGHLTITLLTGRPWEEGQAAQLLASVPAAIARAVETSRKGRGGYTDASSLARDLEAAVLELPMPSKAVPPLAGPDVAMPDDPALLWSEDAEFEDLEHLDRLARDPSYHVEPPEEQDPPTPYSGGGAKPAPAKSAPAPAPSKAAPAKPQAKSAGAANAPMPYQMSRPPAKSKTEKTEPETPLYAGTKQVVYEEAKPRNKADTDVKWEPNPEHVKPAEPDPDAEPFLNNKRLIQLIVLLVVAMIGGSIGVVVWGTNEVAAVQAPAEQSAKALVEHVRGESQLVYALVSAGGDRAALEQAYFTFSEARNEADRTAAAEAFASLVETQARALNIDPAGSGGVADDVSNRVNRVIALHNDVKAKRAAWDRTSRGFPGVIASMLGVAARPVAPGS